MEEAADDYYHAKSNGDEEKERFVDVDFRSSCSHWTFSLD